MHILHICSGDFFSTYGGGQIYVHNISTEMAKIESAKVSVLSFTNKPHDGYKDYRNCKIYETQESGNEQITSLIKEISPEIIHAHGHKAQICRIGKSLNIPVIVTAHHGGIICPAGTLMNTRDEICQIPVCHKNCLKCCLRNTRTGLTWYPFMKLLPRKAYLKLGITLKTLPFIPFLTPIGETALSISNKEKEWKIIADLCAKMIAPCNAIKDAMIRNGLQNDKIEVIPHGIPLPNEKAPFPSTKNGLKFFYVGRICYVKGLHILLEAFHRVNNKKIELHLIGEGANKGEKRYERGLREKYKDDTRIVWHGKVSPDKIFETIKNFHISSSSSYLEAFGLNIAESLAIGKPVFSTRNGGAEMQIEDEINGWLVPANDIVAMKEKIEEIIKLPEDQLATMANTRSVISITEHVNKLLHTYKNFTSA